MAIIRTKNRVTGGITPEEKARMDLLLKEWIDIAFRTKPIEPDKIIPAIEGLYTAAKLKKPRVVIVSSPLVMAFAYGAAAWIWYCRKKDDLWATRSETDSETRSATDLATELATDSATYLATELATELATDSETDLATRSATDLATRSATYLATELATELATYSATRSATDSATELATDSETDSETRSATDLATRSATELATDSETDSETRSETDLATYLATELATRSATYLATYLATRSATDSAKSCYELAGEGGIKCAKNWYKVYQGGNMWSAWCCYLVAYRDILGLDLKEYKNFKPYEEAARNGGFRVMHEEFCMVCDFPEFIKIDEQNRPHCENGASHRWRDGWELYHWHGVAIPAAWVTGNKPSPQEALSWTNLEQRRAACELVGWKSILEQLDAKVIDEDDDPEIGTLLECEIPDSGKERFIKVRCATGRDFVLHVPKEIKTALSAQAWMFQLDEFIKPEVTA